MSKHQLPPSPTLPYVFNNSDALGKRSAAAPSSCIKAFLGNEYGVLYIPNLRGRESHFNLPCDVVVVSLVHLSLLYVQISYDTRMN